jgi:hypothetical protein
MGIFNRGEKGEAQGTEEVPVRHVGVKQCMKVAECLVQTEEFDVEGNTHGGDFHIAVREKFSPNHRYAMYSSPDRIYIKSKAEALSLIDALSVIVEDMS